MWISRALPALHWPPRRALTRRFLFPWSREWAVNDSLKAASGMGYCSLEAAAGWPNSEPVPLCVITWAHCFNPLCSAALSLNKLLLFGAAGSLFLQSAPHPVHINCRAPSERAAPTQGGFKIWAYLRALGCALGTQPSSAEAGVVSGGHDAISHPGWEPAHKLGTGIFFSGDSLLQV